MDFVDRKLADARNQFAFMENKTYKYQGIQDYLHGLMHARHREKLARPDPTVQQFWHAAYTFDPLKPYTRGDLGDIISLNRLHRIPLRTFEANVN